MEPAKLSIVVLGLPDRLVSSDRVGHRGVLDLRGGREAGLQRGDVDEGLERGAGLPLGLHGPVELAAEEIGAADHGLHVAGLGLDRDHGALRGLTGSGLRGATLKRFETVAERLLRGELHGRIERRVDVESALEDQVGAVLRLERLLDVVDEVLAGRPPPLRRDQAEVGLRQALGLLVLENPEVHHPAEDHLAPALRRFAAVERRVVRGGPRQAGDQRRLLHAQLRDGLAEVRPRRRLDAVRAVTEVHLIQVHLEDAVLGVAALELEGQHRLLQLPLEALVRREKQDLGELLGDGAAALDDAARAGSSG